MRGLSRDQRPWLVLPQNLRVLGPLCSPVFRRCKIMYDASAADCWPVWGRGESVVARRNFAAGSRCLISLRGGLVYLAAAPVERHGRHPQTL